MKLSDLQEWLLDVIAKTGINTDVFVGEYVDDGSGKYLISIKKSGGTTRPPFLRYENFTLTIVSPITFYGNVESDDDNSMLFPDESIAPLNTDQTNDEPAWENLERLTEAISIATNGDVLPVGAIGMNLVGNYQGNNYTIDDRIYTTLGIQVII